MARKRINPRTRKMPTITPWHEVTQRWHKISGEKLTPARMGQIERQSGCVS